MKNKLATDVFDNWAINGKDKGMEEGHSLSVDRMVEIASKSISNKKSRISMLDIGCGNGWMLRKVLNRYPHFEGMGIDGARSMIENAKKSDPNGNYLCADLESWKSSEKFDLVMSMEVIYYLNNPQKFIKSLFENSFEEGGVMVLGLDHYAENLQSLSWPQDLNLYMSTMKINQWVDLLISIGFKDVKYEQFNAKKDWAGTLIISGIYSR